MGDRKRAASEDTPSTTTMTPSKHGPWRIKPTHMSQVDEPPDAQMVLAQPTHLQEWRLLFFLAADGRNTIGHTPTCIVVVRCTPKLAPPNRFARDLVWVWKNWDVFFK